jgi:hypothetical protein
MELGGLFDFLIGPRQYFPDNSDGRLIPRRYGNGRQFVHIAEKWV